MTERVGIEFSGSATGAVAASRQVAAGMRSVRAEAAGTSAPLRTLENDLSRTTRGALAGSGAFMGMGRSLAFASAGFLGAAGLMATLRGAADELVNQVKLGAQVSAALRSTGGVAGMTAKSIDELAKAEMRKTGVDETQIKAAEVMLLRFTQVRDVVGKGNDIFTRATKAALDLSAALGSDAATNAATLGRALQDPLKGVTLLRRAKIVLTATEVEHIKTLASEGHMLQAQSAILDAVARSYGGTAKAVADVTPWHRLAGTLKLLSADAIRPLLPEMDAISTRVQKWADGVGNNAAMHARLKRDIEETLSTIGTFAKGANDVAGALGGWKHTIEAIVALKFASMVSGWARPILAASTAAGGLLGRLRALTLSPWTIAIVLSFVHPSSKGQQALDKAGIGFLGHIPILGAALQQEAALEARLLGGSWGTGGGGTQKPVQVGKAGSKTGTSVASYAKQYGTGSGITYHWGGVSPMTGFDCSGYIFSAYASAGVTIPRDTRGQWNDPNAVQVPPGSERPGDGVYFTGSLSGKNAGPPPGHVGIYLGGGIYISYFSEGKPAATANLANAVGYMGARRWLKIKDSSKGADPPTSGTGTGSRATNVLPAAIRGSISRAALSAAAAALTPGKADDRAALAQQKGAVESEIAWLRAKLATNVGAEKKITLEDLLTGALGDLKGLSPDPKKKTAGATVSAVTSLKASITAALQGLPATLDDVETQAVSKLSALRAHLKVGLSAKDLAQTRASIKRWGVVLSDEITKQARLAADAATEAARLWSRSWQNDVDRILRSFQENVVTKQLDDFDRETRAHLQTLADSSGVLTPEERALADFQAGRSAGQLAKQKADIQAQIAATQKQIDSLGDPVAGTGAAGTLIDIATGIRTAIVDTAATSATDLVQQRVDLGKQLADLQDQYHQLELDDQQTALQDAADASRRAADDKLNADQAAYQAQRDAARLALSDRLEDEAKLLAQDLEDWNIWIGAKTKSWADFIAFLKANGIDTAGLGDPNTGSGGATAAPGDAGAMWNPSTGAFVPAGTNVPRGKIFAMAGGGKVSGRFIGRDSVPALLSPGETVIDRKLTRALEQMVDAGGGGGPSHVVTILKINGREFARATAPAMTAEQARAQGYTIQRG